MNCFVAVDRSELSLLTPLFPALVIVHRHKFWFGVFLQVSMSNVTDPGLISVSATRGETSGVERFLSGRGRMKEAVGKHGGRTDDHGSNPDDLLTSFTARTFAEEVGVWRYSLRWAPPISSTVAAGERRHLALAANGPAARVRSGSSQPFSSTHFILSRFMEVGGALPSPPLHH